MQPSQGHHITDSLIQSLPPQSTGELEKLSLAYTSYVRALLGDILEYIGHPTPL